MLNQATFTLIGHVGTVWLAEGKKPAILSIANTTRWREEDGTKRERTEWIRVVVFNPRLQKLISDGHVGKGSYVKLDGHIGVSVKTVGDKEHSEIQLLLDEVGFLSPRAKDAEEAA